MNAPSSLLTSTPAEKVRNVPIAKIVDAYRAQLKFEVGKFLPTIEALEVYRCRDTGLEFFYPLNLEGPPAFYETLYSADDADWAYKDEKWEFVTASRYLGGAGSLLDIGCGGGAFLGFAAKCVARVAGLETSPHGRNAAIKKGIEVHDQTILAHANANKDRYDVVTAFQVLEHVGDPAAFLRAAVDVLKPGGTLLISVPNNDAFLKHCDVLPLNVPPHHLTLWNRRSLEALPRLFPIDVVAIEKEPLQEDNVGWYLSTMETRYLPKLRIAQLLYYKLGGQIFLKNYVAKRRATIDGHTIMAVYRKRTSS